MFPLAIIIFALGIWVGLSFTSYSPAQMVQSALNAARQLIVSIENRAAPAVPAALGHGDSVPSAGQAVPSITKADDGPMGVPSVGTMDSSSGK